MRQVLFEIPFTPLVSLLAAFATVVWSIVLLRRANQPPGASVGRAMTALLTFGSYGSPSSPDLSVSGALGTVTLALLVFALVREPFHLPVFGYAAMLALGFALAGTIAWRLAPRLGADPRAIALATFYTFFFGVVGARAFFVVQFWDDSFADQPARVTFSSLRDEKGDELIAESQQGRASVTLAGDEKTLALLAARLEPLKKIGVSARCLEVSRRVGVTLEKIERGLILETAERGPEARLVLSGSALHAPPGQGVVAHGSATPLLETLALWKGGLVYYGGMVFGGIAFFLAVHLRGQRFLPVGDLAASVGGLGLAFGRVGCFLNGCCWGREVDASPFSIRFPVFTPAWFQHVRYVLPASWDPVLDAHVLTKPLADELRRRGCEHLTTGSNPVHPVQLYAIALDLMLFAVVYAYARFFAKREGQVFFLIFILYGFVRFTVEHFRGDHVGFALLMSYPLTPSQRVALLTVPIGLLGFLWASRRGRPITPWTA